jgi:hypothetical protein
MHDGRAIGMLEAAWHASHAWTDDELTILERTASQPAVAIHNAEVIAELERWAAQLGVVRASVSHGGGEFAVILPEPDGAAARAEAAGITRAFAESSFRVSERSPVPIGASTGVAAFPSGARTVGELIAAADADLYRAKRAESEPQRAESEPQPTVRLWDRPPTAGHARSARHSRTDPEADEAGHDPAGRLLPPVASPGPA